MIQAMYSGVSGLKAFKTKLDVIGNNVANVNTIGFKGSRVNFRDMLSQTISGGNGPGATLGGINPMQVGLGVTVGSIDVNQIQGSLQATGKMTDAAIEGGGFFVLSTGSGMQYTRDGAFGVDGAYNLVSSSGLRVMGWAADAAGNVNVSQPISDIRIPIGQMSIAKPTSIVRFGGNLDAVSTAATAPCEVNPSIYDSLGIKHELKVAFTKTANPNEWSFAVTSAEGTVTNGTGTVVFDTAGKVMDIKDAGGNSMGTDLVSAVQLDLTTANGSTKPIQFDISLGSVSQLQGMSTAGPTYQDGIGLGTLVSFSIGKDGTVSGQFDNGSVQTLGRVALAEFANPVGLNKVGSNMLAESPNSGTAQIGAPGTGSRGKIASGFLESSNVDLSSEFTEMIVAQRGFQANSRIITVADQVLQELVQLTR